MKLRISEQSFFVTTDNFEIKMAPNSSSYPCDNVGGSTHAHVTVSDVSTGEVLLNEPHVDVGICFIILDRLIRLYIRLSPA